MLRIVCSIISKNATPKLINLLKILSPDEFRLFYKFVRSIYYQNNENLVNLYKYLRKYYPDFSPEKVKKEKVFAKLFPGRPFNANTMATLMSKMVKLVEEYLLILDIREDEFERKKRLTQIYRKRNQHDFFKKGNRELLKELEKEPFPNYREQIDLYHSLYFHPKHNRYSKEDQSLEKLMDSLDHYFALTKMRYGIALKNKQKILSKPYSWRFMEALEPEFISLHQPILFRLYQSAFALLEERDDSNFDEFESLLFSQIQALPPKDKNLLYFTGLNYVNQQVNKGNSIFSSIAFGWYKHGLEHDLLIRNQRIDETSFSNIVVYGCREKEFEWTKTFIQTYQTYLDQLIRTDVVVLNLAWLQFSMNDFDKVLSILTSHSFPDKYQPKIRLTIIRTLFELFLRDWEYYEVMTSHIHSFEMYIFRNEFFSESALLPYLNCIRMIKGLAIRISDREDLSSIKAWLFDQIEIKSQTIASYWLLEKMNQL